MAIAVTPGSFVSATEAEHLQSGLKSKKILIKFKCALESKTSRIAFPVNI